MILIAIGCFVACMSVALAVALGRVAHDADRRTEEHMSEYPSMGDKQTCAPAFGGKDGRSSTADGDLLSVAATRWGRQRL